MLRKFVVWALLCSILFGMTGARAAEGFSGDPVAVEAAAQSVLMLEVYSQGELIATGSGFVAFADDMLVTNSHVIDGADEILAKSDQGDEYVLDKIYAVDTRKDLAILGFSSPTKLSPLKLDTERVVMRVEPVVAIGSPKGLLNTVSVGNVSAVFIEEGTRYIQFTAPVSSGSSGGALFGNDGDVIGITTSVWSDQEELVQNLNFAIHIAEAAGLEEKVNKKAWIPAADYPAFQNTNADFPGETQVADNADSTDVQLALAGAFVLFSPCIALLMVPPHRAKPSARPAPSPVPADWIGPLQSFADGAIKRDAAHAFDMEWEELELDQDGYQYYAVTVREGSASYPLFAGIADDGMSGILFVMDMSDSLRGDEAYGAIIRDLGEAFIKASGVDGLSLFNEIRSFRRSLDGFTSGGNLDEAYKLYGDLAYFDMEYTRSDAEYPDTITMGFFVKAPAFDR